VQFLKPYVQFLMDTILNPVIVQFLMKKKGDAHYRGASPMSRKRRHALWGTCLLCQEKGDTCHGDTSPIYLTPQKRLSTKYSPRDALCASMLQYPLAQIRNVVFMPMGTQRARCKKHRVEHKLFKIFKILRLSCV
jgi:hypothetical protein